MNNNNTKADKRKALIDLGFTEIPGYPNYWAREDGIIGSSNNIGNRYPLIPKLAYDDRGYQRVRIVKSDSNGRASVHRLIAQTFITNPFSLPQVNHKDGVKTNNTVENLE